ncbi:MAG TPA: hypothetical protein VMI53_06525 [Opitutaceae bacterium]|nr:hypothetical protein [Opitutaceae bacterium]
MEIGEGRVKQGAAQGKAENAARRNAVGIFLARITRMSAVRNFTSDYFNGNADRKSGFDPRKAAAGIRAILTGRPDGEFVI